MADITKCPVCLDEYEDPKLLPCSHTMWRTCLNNLPKSSAKKGKQQVTCPICNFNHKVPERGLTAFPDNQAMIQLIANKQVRLKTPILMTRTESQPMKSLKRVSR